MSQATPQHIAFVGKEVNVMLGFRGELMRELAAKGHKVYAFAIDYDTSSELKIREMGFIPVRFSLNGYSANPFSDLLTLWQLYRAFKKHRISMSFCYFAKPAIFGTLAAWAARVPQRIAKIEGLGRPFTEGKHGLTVKMRVIKKVQCWLFRLALPRSTALIVLNQDDKKDLKEQCKVDMPNTVVLGGIGVCLEQFKCSPVPVTPLTFVFVGRLLNEKGIRYFLDVAERVKAKHPEALFKVVGGATTAHGVSLPELKQYVKRGVIDYVGHVDNVVPYIESSSVFVLPSYYREGLPRSTQEALAIGRPVITTDGPGCKDTVEHGVNGYRVPRHDTNALENAVLNMVNHPDKLQSMGYASRAMAEQRFNVRDVNRRLLNVLNL
ncbi:glycosyltransferase family 4 protein [Idiomarina sp. Sol25]|uniref:glycosyltransferase family 4 protein n=1 Tax=Idiomarina sp. Sol25 TaxID=3064000 RepID=UPI00294B6307|nr:glycosyltransferase family 4 protein [Idiomarina sp. Sol25]MDV6328071.1 glycosyltransferase family 4 protein [Idiomarina sp. Sol25]